MKSYSITGIAIYFERWGEKNHNKTKTRIKRTSKPKPEINQNYLPKFQNQTGTKTKTNIESVHCPYFEVN